VKRWALDILACPETGDPLELWDCEPGGTDVVKDHLRGPGGSTYPIIDGIPRFVPEANYCASFGLQWNRYSRLRSDRYNGTHLLRDTIERRFGWKAGHLAGKTVLECGCGSGNDTEILLELGAERIVAFDYSTSVEAAARNILSERVQFLQADIMNIPVRREAFDVVYCHRVIQHTPSPEAAFRSIARHLAPGGELALHSYDAHLRSMFHFKYLWRPLTRRLPPATLIAVLERVGPVLYPLQALQIRLFKGIRYLRGLGNKLIPFYNYAHIYREAGSSLTDRELFQVSLLDTFDALSPTYDNPSTAQAIIRWFEEAGLSRVELKQRNPIVVVGRRSALAMPASTVAH
jgi:ubiquinone/menaquinone biosynthesis C-methylase UbiE/uncharacterized protein YbaR (Trm112 family)